ncbi:MAG: DUF4349 domain-containing protein, partial [Oscillospiraceae bacterium]|nr:DUF4349 domain-containing protein [Oscillospiraceae bacterium]
MKKICVLLAALLCAVCVLVSCAGAGSDTAAVQNYGYTAETPMAEPAETEVYEEAGVATDSASTTGGTSRSTAEQYGLKIVYNAYLSIETLDFDESVASINAAISAAGGYVSYSEQYGGQTYNGGYRSRSAYYTARIPADEYESFLNRSSEFGNVTNSSSSTQDITSSYIDTEARLNSLRAEEEQLLALLKQSGTLEDLIAVQDRLSEVRYQIESYTS